MNDSLPGTDQENPSPGSNSNPRAGHHDLLINVLGASFSITAGEDPVYLSEVLAQYQVAVANTQGISGMKDPLKVAILTGFLLCDEINKLKLQVKEDRAGDEQKLNQITENLITRLDVVMKDTHSINDPMV